MHIEKVEIQSSATLTKVYRAFLRVSTRDKIWEALVEERHFNALRNSRLNPRRFNARRGQTAQTHFFFLTLFKCGIEF